MEHAPGWDAKRLAFYNRGATDREIAEAFGIWVTQVGKWRRTRGLPINPSKRPHAFTEQQSAARMLLYQLGWGDRRIAAEQRVDDSSVREWRRRRGLAPNHAKHRKENRDRNTVDQLIRRVRRAVGMYLARDIVDDVVASMFEALLDGTLPLAEIEREARRYGNRTLDRFASRFGPRSLDEEIGEAGDGFRMIDLIRDDRSSSWLEEMGATVW